MSYHSTKISSSSHSGRGLNFGSDSNLLEGHEYVPRIDTQIKEALGTERDVWKPATAYDPRKDSERP